ncbi:septum formation initiator [Corynebacterium sp. YIM 101645]|uniref:Septum formation initiator n=1 Tax=Corynebacterium lemuris TaxID=1859292 RepID=A0ABT2FSV7_9CORY|nr:septum site-determining protein Ssd [Corynebacterium lemuris]MCS5478307.1 septum formation initiator [Corynebacterium lemuris]
MSSTYILVAVGDPVIHPEATHIAAATGHGVIDTIDPREITRLLPRAHALLADADTAGHVATLDRRPGIYFLAADPGPADWRAALTCHAENAYVLPAQAAELLTALGHARAPQPGQETHPTAGRTALARARHAAPAAGQAGGTLIAVCGAVGGAGTSTLAAALARTVARHHPVTLIDADGHSGGLDLLLGLEDTPGARWPDLRLGEGTVAGTDLRAALPTTPDGIAVLSAARSTLADPFRLRPEHMRPVLEALDGSPGITVVDLPAHGPVTETVTGTCDRLALLIPAEVRAAAAAAGLVTDLARGRTATIGIARHRGWSGLTADDLSRITRCQIIGELGQLSRLPRTVELGGLPDRLPGPLGATTRLIAEDAGVAL